MTAKTDVYSKVINEYFEYDFELDNVLKFIGDAQMVILQFPEGLIRYATKISNHIQQNTKVIPIILGDVVYGACNFDEYVASMYESKKYIHFGHSQIVKPFNNRLDCFFVPCKLLLRGDDLKERKEQLLAHIIENGYKSIQLTATAQTNHLIQEFIKFIHQNLPEVIIKSFQFTTLPENELLGCTCRKIENVDAIYSVVDGLFHMEAVKVAGSSKVYQFNLIAKTIIWLAENDSDVQKRKQQRIQITNELGNKFQVYKNESQPTSQYQLIKLNIVFGTLGRQSSIKSLLELQKFLNDKTNNISYLIQPLQEIFPFRLNQADIIVQLSCPRLTFDWGAEFQKNVLGLWEFWQLLQYGKMSEYKLLNFSGDIEEAGIYLDFHNHGNCQ